ncbi:hypothetical protein ACGF1Z_23990 [Streptomyces sp. NPDC048018]|uniref:hypothetical protein n=1 Tax=Streptomyces sp. NPDC048018 TaxID=3365499 RepID=UPI00371E33A9
MTTPWTDLGNNVCGILHDRHDATAVTARFARTGWRSRSSSWYGYEVETGWCRLEVDPVDGPDILLNGAVDPARLDDLAQLLTSFGFAYTLELRDGNDTLVRELRG